MRAAIDGTLTENDPVSSVRAAKIIHWLEIGWMKRLRAEYPVTDSPAPITEAM